MREKQCDIDGLEIWIKLLLPKGTTFVLKMDLLGSILNSMDAPPKTQNKQTKGILKIDRIAMTSAN